MIAHLQSVPKSVVWCTPPEIFAGLRKGGIEMFDLDPAHPGRDNPHCVVPARQVYTEADNGLIRPWHGLVFLNPPFGKPRRRHVPFLKLFFAHGNGVAICNALTSSDWWHEWIVPNAQVLVFPEGKTKFIDPYTGKRGEEPANGVALLGVGEVACTALRNCGLGWVVENRVDGALRGEQ
jgi:hypothetical protein